MIEYPDNSKNDSDDDSKNENVFVPQKRPLAIAWILLCVPGMGMNLWGVGPLYIIRNIGILIMMTISKSTSRRQVRGGDEPCEGSRSANLRVNGQKLHIRLNLGASKHNIRGTPSQAHSD